MPIAYDQDVTLRLIAQAEGEQDISKLEQTVDQLRGQMVRLESASRAAAAAQVESSRRLAAAKSAYDGTAATLMGVRNEYRYLSQRAKEAGAGQAEFAAQADRAKQRVSEYQAKLKDARSAVREMGAEHRNAAGEVRRLGQEQRQLEEAMRTIGSSAKQNADGVGLLSAGMRRLAGVAAGLQISQEFIESNLAIESLERTMTQLTGSSTEAAREIEWLREASARLGVQVNDAARAYASLSAATKGTALEGRETHAIFEAVAGAMAKLGRSSADTEGALQAISQMVGKGTVQMEELRGQLAERLPGALAATAKAMGLTTSELVDMVGSGQVLASDLIPKLTQGLNELYGTGKIEGTQAAWNRFKNSVSETLQMLGQDGGIMAAAIAMLEGLNKGVRVAAAGMEFLGKALGTTAAATTTFDLSHPILSLKAFNDEIQALRKETRKKFGLSFDDEFEAKVREFWGLQTEAAADAAEASTRAGEAAHAAAAQSVGAADRSSGSWLAVAAAYTKANKEAAAATVLSVKSAEARKAEGDVAMALARSFGTEADQRRAAEVAARANVTTLEAVAAARKREADLAREQVAAQLEAAGGEARLTAEQQKAVQASREAASAKQAEADKSAAAAEGARMHAAALETASLAVADNAGRLGELNAAMQSAAAEYLRMQQLQSQGDATDQEVEASKIRLAQATSLYRDALSDQTAAIERQSAAQQAAQQITLAQLSADQQIARTQLELARLRNDSRGVLEAQNKLRQIEIKMLQVTAEGARAEAKATLAAAEAKKAELAATGQLTPARQAEIDKMIASAKLKQVEAEKSDQLARLQRELADELERVERRGRGAGDGLAESYDKAANASDRLNDSIRNRPDEVGGTSGPEVHAGQGGLTGRQQPGIVEREVSTFSVDNDFIARQAGLTGEAVGKFSAVFSDILAYKMAEFRARFSNTSIMTAQGYRSEVANYEKQAIALAASIARRRDPASSQSTKTVTVNIKQGGREIPIVAADEASAENLVRAIELAAKVAS